MSSNIRQGRCDFADRDGRKHTMVWTVSLDTDWRYDKKQRIRKTDILTLMLRIDDEKTVSFEFGTWNKRPPLFGVARDAYRMLLALYS